VKIPKPISFNPLKHHKEEILYFLENAAEIEFKDLIDSVCHNHVDIYTGSISSNDISDSVIISLKEKGVYNKEDYEYWVRTGKGYRVLILDDNSIWILRIGDTAERYIHFHPARSGKFTVRFRGSTLKTVYQLRSDSSKGHEPLSLESVNLARMQIGLSPVKRLVPGKGIMRCWDFFNLLSNA